MIEKANGSRECRTLLLSDDPTQTDRFGAHSRVASAITSLILEEKGGQSIGLIGPWGSGKSSVLRIAESASKDKIAFFVFDAWAHQNDPLRRTFLEKLLTFVQENHWLEASQTWQDERSKLAGVVDEQTISSEQILTLQGIVAAGSILLFAFFAQIFSLDKLLGRGWQYRIAFVGLVGMIATLLILLATVILARKERKTIWGVLLNKGSEVKRIRTTKTPEPSSIEFQNLFSKILTESFSKRKTPLVIAIDNLDRVSQSDSFSMWSALRAFLELRSFRHSEWLQSVWLLVPFDPTIIKAWTMQTEPDSEEAQSFIEKTFQVTFQLGKPIVSDWQDFMLSQLAEALPDHDPSDFEDVLRLLQTPFAIRLRPETPRQIKFFVNRLGAFHRQWHDEVPLVMQCLYIHFLTRQNFNIVNALQTPHDESIFGGPMPVGLLPAEWRDWIAALHFGVPRDRARSLFLNDAIITAVESDKESFFDDQELVPGFLRAFEEVLTYRAISWAKNGAVSLAYSARVVTAFATRLDATFISRLMRTLSLACKEIENWSDLNLQISGGIVALLKWNKSEDFDKLIVNSLSRSAPRISDTAVSSRQVSGWIDGLAEVFKQCAERNRDTLQLYSIPTNSYPLYEAMVEAAEQQGSLPQFRELARVRETGAILSHIQSILSQERTFSSPALSVLKALVANYPTLKYSTLIVPLDGIFSRSPTGEQPGQNTALHGLLLLTGKGVDKNIRDAASQQLSSLVTNGMVASSLASAKKPRMPLQ